MNPAKGLVCHQISEASESVRRWEIMAKVKGPSIEGKANLKGYDLDSFIAAAYSKQRLELKATNRQSRLRNVSVTDRTSNNPN